jgi:hypothetical protein
MANIKATLGNLVATGAGLFFNYAQNIIAPQRKIGEFSGFVVTEESAIDELEITEHPVQSGAAITDHAYKKPAEVSVKFMYGVAQGDLSTLYQELLDFQKERELFSVTTGKRTYSNMLLKSLSLTTDKNTENVLSLSADFKEIIVAELETTTMPARANQKMAATTGSTSNVGVKNAKKVSNEQSAQLERSALYTAFGG